MTNNIDKNQNFSDSNILANWFAPFNIAVDAGESEELFDLTSPYWGSTNLVSITYGGKDVKEASPFTNEDGSAFNDSTTSGTLEASVVAESDTTYAAGTHRNKVTYLPAAFTAGSGRIYSEYLYPSVGGLGTGAYDPYLYIRFDLTRAAINALDTHTLSASLIEYNNDNTNTIIKERVLSDGIEFGTDSTDATTFNKAFFNRKFRVNRSSKFRLVLESTLTVTTTGAASTRTLPNITLEVPGLQVVVFRDITDANRPTRLGDVLGGLRNDTGTVTQWNGTPWASTATVFERPNYIKRINFTSITGGTPGVSFDSSDYLNALNVIELPTGQYVFSGGDVSMNVGSTMYLRNTHASASSTFKGVLVGLYRYG